MNREQIGKLEQILGSEKLILSPEGVAPYETNSLGVQRSVAAVVFPTTTHEVQQLVLLANQPPFMQLYPISRGNNKGYGDKSPVKDGQIVVDLSRMNRIRHYEPQEGYVVIEPGVTQGQLFTFLSRQPEQWMMDATGAGPQSSIIGNTLDGGFGHTPLGNRRKNVSSIEAVLGNGDLFDAGTFPAMGPDLNPIFVQSNFGIVTAARIKLMARPERYYSFRATTRTDEGFEEMIDKVRELREKGTLTSLVHVADPVRMLVTVGIPQEYKGKRISSHLASNILSRMFYQQHFWTAVGGIYGSNREAEARKRELASEMKSIGAKIMFFTDEKIRNIQIAGRILEKAGLRNFGQNVQNAMRGYNEIHGMMKGMSSPMPEQNMEDFGFMWISPTFGVKGKKARQVYDIALQTFEKFGYDLPFTITLVEPDRAVGIINVKFQKSDEADRQRAYELYFAVKDAYAKSGIYMYRTTILDMETSLKVQTPESWQTYKRIKQALDPNGVISPGRYCI